MTFTRLTNARIEWQEGLPFSTEFGDIYFSRDDAIAETTHVFLEGNRLTERFAATESHFVIGECGFGSGLNFLCAWDLFRRTAKPGTRLYFISTEQFPLTPDDLKRFHELWPELKTLSGQLQAQYPYRGQGLHRLQFCDDNHQINLDLMLGEASEQFMSLLPTHSNTIDAWFLDGFAPRSNPDMWSSPLCSSLAQLSHAQSTLATYSVSASVRDALVSAGFQHEKHPGYGRKRHMLRATLLPTTKPTVAFNTDAAVTEVCIVGGGLAGCNAARSLAEKGVKVTLFEQAENVAAGASGNPRGVMFLPLHRAPSLKANYLRLSFHFARRRYQNLLEQYPEIDWQPCGALQMTRKNSEDYFERVAENPVYDDSLVRLVDEKEASILAGVSIRQDALHLPLSGTLNPSALCSALIDHQNITVNYHADIDHIEKNNDTWALYDKKNLTVISTPHLVIANGLGARALLPDQDYPLFPNRGQLTSLNENSQSEKLRLVLCGKGYLSPAVNGLHVCGGSFNPGDSDTEQRDEDDEHNLSLLNALCPDAFEDFSMASVKTSRTALRCTTRDYFPLAGPVETLDPPLTESISGMSCQSGLYLFSGLGSHGITTSPMAAEYLACLITGEPVPLTLPTSEIIAPARFRWRRER